MTDFDGIPLESVRRLRRSEYDRMVDLGMFEDERVELLDGILVVGHRASPPHAESVRRLTEALMPTLQGRARLQVRAPFAASDYSVPEPDLALIPPRDYSTQHPSTAFLVIEVADSSLRKNRALKGRFTRARPSPSTGSSI